MDKKISELDLVSTLDVNDVLPIVNQGSTKKVKISQLVVTNLTYAPAISNGQVLSDNGTSAILPLADELNAGLFSASEKSKLNGIQSGAEVNVNADWNAISGDALILNKPTILSPSSFVPYVGANSNLDMGEYGATVSQLTLDTTPTQSAIVGTTQWNDSLGATQTTLKGGNVVLKNGVDLIARIVNKVTPNTTLTKANYQAVRVSGATGQRLSVELAQGNIDLNSADTIGLVTETIATNQEGFIITMGQLENINTTGSLQSETWADGDVLYLSPTVAGRLTNIKPTGLTGHIVVIGYVEYSHINNGKIYVKIMNGWELDELHNVYIDNALANEDFLQYESASQLWKNKPLTATLIRSKLGITTLSGSNTGDQDLSGLVVKNTPITGATKTKITYDAKGLVINGVDATTSDIADSTNRRYVTDANLIVIGNTSGTNTGDNATNTQYSGLATSKQDNLVSGTNIKTINSNSILGSGDLVIGSAVQSSYSILANNTNASAIPIAQVYKDIAEQTYTGTLVWTTTAPTTIIANTYKWNQIGSLVTVRVNLNYTTAGSITQVTISLPTDMPIPLSPSGFTGALDILYYGTGMFNSTTVALATASRVVLLRRNSANNGYEFVIAYSASISSRTVHLTLQYFT